MKVIQNYQFPLAGDFTFLFDSFGRLVNYIQTIEIFLHIKQYALADHCQWCMKDGVKITH